MRHALPDSTVDRSRAHAVTLGCGRCGRQDLGEKEGASLNTRSYLNTHWPLPDISRCPWRALRGSHKKTRIRRSLIGRVVAAAGLLSRCTKVRSTWLRDARRSVRFRT